MKTMFIGQGSSIVGVCVVCGLSPLVHHFNCLYKPLIHEEKQGQSEKERERSKQDRHIHRKREKDSLRDIQERKTVEREIDCKKIRRSRNRLISVLT
jgi:hypothetical protein